MVDAQQELFTELFLKLKEQGFDVYDGALPPDGTPYPFVYLGDCRQSDRQTKSQIMGSVYINIHVWGNNPRKRGEISRMLLAIKQTCRSIGHTSNFAWMVGDLTQRIIPDNTTKTPLLHGIIEAEFRFS